MAEGCGPKCAKMMLIIFNVLFWLSGCALIAVGIWLIVEPSVVQILDFVIEVTSGELIRYAAYVLIAIGGFVFIVGFLGCCGAIKENKVMLGIYIFLLFLVMAGELAGGILAIIYKDQIIDTIDDEVLKSMKNPGKNYTKDATMPEQRDNFWQLMDYVQSEFKCCGVKGPIDYDASGANFPAREPGRPHAYGCYPLKSDKKPSNFLTEADVDTLGTLHSAGCNEAIRQEIEAKAIILIGVGIGIACLEIFGFIFAICLCRNTSKD